MLVPLLLALTACPKETPSEGAVKLTVTYKDFVPRCVRVTAKDVELTQQERTTELLGKGDASGGTLTVAIFREQGWGHTLELTAEAFERANGAQCVGASAVRQTRTVTVGTKVEEPTLELLGQDTDRDGFLATALGGSDCDDDRADVKPGELDVCNGRDDDCNGTRDDGFEVGQLCDLSGGCQGAWACDTVGTRVCRTRQGQWYPDGDGDGHGAKNGTPVDACTQPAGHVPNSDDCNDADNKVHPGAPERCTEKDEDCDGDPFNGFNVDTACTNGACQGVRACVADGGVECNAPTPFTRYVDRDNDGHGARGTQPDTLCAHPDGGYSDNNTDCDDTDSTVHPSAPERCTNKDEDCDGNPFNGLNLDAACSPDGGCTGKRACDGLGGVTCQVITGPTTWYPDEDLDTRGKADAGVALCSPPDGGGYVDAGTDCDDGDPFTYTGAPELCDRKDNNCDGTQDGTGVCPANPAWTLSQVGSTTRSWNSLSLYGDGGVWVVGINNGRALKTPQSNTFTTFETSCTGNWHSAWADPVTGKLYMGGASNQVATQDVGATACVISTGGRDITYGLRGFRANGSVDLYGVGSKPDFTGGWGTRWNGGVANQDISSVAVTDPLIRVAGPSPNLLFAAGGAIGNEPRIYRFDTTSQTWKRDTTVPTSGLGFLADVSVVHPTLAYAGGNSGSFLKWDGKTWSALPAPHTSHINGILAFGSSAVYAVTNGGEILRYNGTAWEVLADFGITLTDIDGRSPGDIWVTGDGGRIFHWPQ